MSFPKYPKYKDSGVEWLGYVPEHWNYAALTRIANRIVVGIAEAATHAYADAGVPILRSTNVRAGKIIGDILYIDPAFAGDRNSKKIAAGDLVTVRTGNAGVTAVVPAEFDGCQCFTMLITSLSDSKSADFYCYWMNSLSAQCYFSLEGWGTAQVNISVPILKALPVPIPPRAEQTAIASFLDAETSKIDALIAEQRRLIELLKEKRQAVISHAVTKGLNPDAPMKPSGIEWLGDVPEHWVVCQVRRVIRRIEQGWSPECVGRPAEASEWGVMKTGCVNRGIFNADENKALPEELAPATEYEIRAGDVLVSRASGSPELVGSTAFVQSVRPQLLLSDKTFRVHLEPTIEPRFFVAAFSSRMMRDQIEQSISGADGLANNLPQATLKRFSITIPSIPEQKGILAFLDAEIAKFDALTAEAERGIELLQERRTALISATVTGKIDVRELAETGIY